MKESYMSIDLETLKHVPKESGVHELIRSRWSPRTYSDKPISNRDLSIIFSAASWAASSYNEQPWRFIVGHKGDETYAQILETLVEFNQSWAKSSPVLILTLAKTTLSKDSAANGWALHDLGAASANMCLQAIALGIHTHGMAGFDKDKARASFGLPADYVPGTVWALGYLGDPATLPDQMQSMELAPRTRKSLEEIVFTAWNKPVKF
jgi:nitroreductase